MRDDVRSLRIATNGIALRADRAGPDDGPPVILLHGFPETSACWRRQIAPLAAAGYRITAPDQRGYATSDKPAGVAAYNLDALAADVLGLIDESGRQKACLVGHDWGGLVAWWVAVTHPGRVERLVVLNAPHPVAFRRAILSSPRQLLRSWYILAFQIPWLPETFARLGNWNALANVLRSSSRPGTFPDTTIDEYRRAWSEPGAITAMIHWYRAAFRRPPARPPDLRVKAPTLILWGARDRFLSRSVAEASLALCEAGRLEFIEEATHWVQHEEPDRVNRLLLDFLGGGDLGSVAQSRQ